MTDEYSNYPKSITEVRSDQSGDGKDCTPRDVLIAMLRKIDSGEINPDILIVSYREPGENGGHSTGFIQSTVDGYATVGVLHSNIFEISK